MGQLRGCGVRTWELKHKVLCVDVLAGQAQDYPDIRLDTG